jgi:hypothetical protein
MGENKLRRILPILGWVIAAVILILYLASRYEISFHKKSAFDQPLTNTPQAVNEPLTKTPQASEPPSVTNTATTSQLTIPLGVAPSPPVLSTQELDAGGSIPSAQQLNISAVYIEPSASLLRDTIEVRAGGNVLYNWALTGDSRLVAEFQVEGGLNNRVNVWLLDTPNYQRYAARQEFTYFKGTSGVIKDVGKYEFTVPANDTYYLVVDNGKAWFLPRKVKMYVYTILPQATADTLQQERLFNQMYQQLKKVFIFPDFQISIRHCGLENAFSNPNITLCTELLEDLAEQRLPSATSFVFFHELGHTLLRGWGLPTWDNEDVADEFATVMMMMGNQESGALQAAQWWASQASTQEALSKIYTDDRHTISPQRARNIIRWLNSGNDLVTRWQQVLIPNMQTVMLLQALHDSSVDRALVLGELRKRGVATP